MGRGSKDAGMKYMVFTTKHHDGFCMFDTKYTDYKITDKACPFSSNPRSNVTKEIFNAFRKENFGSALIFQNPTGTVIITGGNNFRPPTEIVITQFKNILSNGKNLWIIHRTRSMNW